MWSVSFLFLLGLSTLLFFSQFSLMLWMYCITATQSSTWFRFVHQNDQMGQFLGNSEFLTPGPELLWFGHYLNHSGCFCHFGYYLCWQYSCILMKGNFYFQLSALYNIVNISTFFFCFFFYYIFFFIFLIW